MADRKYGRIYTESDIEKIFAELAAQTVIDPNRRVIEFPSPDIIIKALDDEGKLTIPEDEPTFLIRGQDNVALHAIGFYRSVAVDLGANLQTVTEAYADFIRWRHENPSKCKVPD